MRAVFAGLGALIAMSACGASGRQASPSGGIGTSSTGWVSYRDPSGVSLTKPSSWTAVPGAEGPLVVYIDPASGVPFRRNINILHQQQAQPVTMSQYTDVTKQEFNQIADFTETSSAQVTLSGHAGLRVLWRGELPGMSTPLSFLSEWIVVSGRPWLVTYTADPGRFADALPQAERLIDSLALPS